MRITNVEMHMVRRDDIAPFRWRDRPARLPTTARSGTGGCR